MTVRPGCAFGSIVGALLANNQPTGAAHNRELRLSLIANLCQMKLTNQFARAAFVMRTTRRDANQPPLLNDRNRSFKPGAQRRTGTRVTRSNGPRSGF